MSAAAVAEAGLPEVAEIDEWQRVNRLSVLAESVRALARSALPVLAIFVGSAAQDGQGLSAIAPFAVPIVLGIVALNLGGSWLRWWRLRYRIGANDVRVEQGVLSRTARSVPYDRIQDVSLEQKLIPRLLGLVEVRFETGAGGKDELKLAYVTEAEGERLRETVRALAEEESGSAIPSEQGEGESSTAASEGGRTLFAMGPRRLFTYGLFNFSLVVFAILLGALQQFQGFVPFDPWGWLAAFVTDGGYVTTGSYLSHLGLAAQIAAALYFAGGIVVVGLASGVIITFLRDWKFRLERTTRGFRRRRGLLTKTDVMMPAHRVQAMKVSTGWLRRLFGWHGLSFISLAQDSGAANHDVAPFARMAEIAPIVEEAQFALPVDALDWRRSSRRYRTDRLLLSAGTCFIAAGAFLLAKAVLPADARGLGLGAVLMAAIGVMFAAQQAFLWRHQRHALDETFLFTRRHWLAPEMKIASRIKLQSVEISQGPLSRLRGYADLNLGLAGGKLAIPGLPLEEARRIRGEIVGSITAVDFAKLPR
ncbi:PH domain-containing protein [Aurantiacibacter spongiae]|uniref:YdbS-like PH domain-containing protein n=1 Tax=Aurantiacibacter spongiae TaxID=2488860 RepID=A0A3N5CV40_9SPHN|nr:PH domain-containing protein [Aurantiacibacter spongiae]RPF71320.1 hypothetical protein EG799_06635 [Aurantiacibacter spongiae]